MTADEWDACTNPADMLDALTEAKYPAEYIRYAALTIAEGFQPTERDWSEYIDHSHWEGERESKHEQYVQVTGGMEALRKPDCPDPAKQFRDAMSHVTPVQPQAADFLRKTFPDPFRPPFRSDCVTG